MSLPQKYDAVVGDTTILANRSSYVDFTFPFIKSGVGLIVHVEDQVKRDSISFLKPLTWKLWITSFFFFFLIGFTVWVVEHRVNPDFRGPPEFQASTIFWYAFSTMVFAPSKFQSPILHISTYSDCYIFSFLNAYSLELRIVGERVFSFGARLLVKHGTSSCSC